MLKNTYVRKFMLKIIFYFSLMNPNKDHMISRRLCMDASPILENYLTADEAGLALKNFKIKLIAKN